MESVNISVSPINEENYRDYFSSFSYELSPFQKQAIAAIVDGNHVLVCAPTGSGKTLPAEFAIEYFTKLGKRVIYTSPIKALSNQKYYDFSLKFPDISIGLCTGDIKTNTEAQLILMTAEILTNQLFNMGATRDHATPSLNFQMDISTELGVVIMDEVHYINDEARGKTWEQTIMMLPNHIQMVMLSATLDDPYKFARWIEEAKSGSKKTIVALTNHRIVPLTHYVYVASTQSFVKNVKDKETSQFIVQNTNKIMKIQNAAGKFELEEYKKIQKIMEIYEQKEATFKRKFVLNSVAEYLKQEEMLPAIVFTLSRARVESDAADITANLLEDDSKIPYIMARECEAILRGRLSNYREYMELAEYKRLIALLEKGVGIHHSGMIPILREIVEMQISRGAIKLLFATESFAIGLNCPIKTAVFSGLTKYDGNTHRYLYAHEYTQMAGRAGRRGIDSVGHVVHLANLFELPLLNEYKTVLSGKPQCLVSKFQIDYSMILHLIGRDESLDNLYSFSEKSMGFVDIKKRAHLLKTKSDQLELKLREKRELCEKLQTPLTVCLEYIELEKSLPFCVNKKRKEVERKMTGLREYNKWIIQNIGSVKEMQSMENELYATQSEIEGELTYLKSQTQSICCILEKEGFIVKPYNEKGETQPYTICGTLGKIATYMNELHPLVMAKLIVRWENFRDFSVGQLVAYLSIFTDIRVAEEYRYFEPRSKDTQLLQYIRETEGEYFKYKQLEIDYGIRSGFHYELMYDLVDDILEWADCCDEYACRNFIVERLETRQISLGDFVKAVLKICAIAKEWMAMCSMEGGGFVELEYKLSKVDGVLLKYVTTSQSLYV